MVPPQVLSLIGAVRRRLWRLEFAAAARWALWGSAASMLAVAAFHLGVRPIGAATASLAPVALWAAAIAWASSRRPTDLACALWADRNLAGSSSYTTLLDVDRASRAPADAEAIAWLVRWATARVPESTRRLAERNDPTRMSGPLLVALVCTALAALVLALPGSRPATQRRPIASPAGSLVGAPSAPASLASAQTERVDELVRALQSSAAPADSRRGESDRAAGAGPVAQPSDARSGGEASSDANPSGKRSGPPNTAEPSVETRTGARPSSSAAQTGGGAGRRAGDSAGDRGGRSAVQQGPLAVRTVEMPSDRPSRTQQADADEIATYDDRVSNADQAPAPDEPAAAAAAPPATAGMRLTPTQSNYVRAWMIATRQLH
jgi:hypothetical protein